MINHSEHILALQKEMVKGGIDAALVTTHINMFYLLGGVYDGFLYIPAEGEALHFIRKGNAKGKIFTLRKPEQIPDILKENGLALPESLMLEDDYLSVREYFRLEKIFNCKLMPDIIRSIRSIKSAGEIEAIRKAADIQSRVYRKIPSLFKEGMTDYDLQIALEHEARILGNAGLMRAFGRNMEISVGSLLVGDNALIPAPFDFSMGGAGMYAFNPIGTCGASFTDGVTAMIDTSINADGYLTDMTRIFSYGKLPDEAYRLQSINKEILDELSLMSKEGVICGELYDKADSIIKKYNVVESYMESFNNTRFTGHGLGLEINEPPVIMKYSKAVLKENMVIAIEPKFALKSVGGLGNENTYLIKKNSSEKLTICPEEIINLK